MALFFMLKNCYNNERKAYDFMKQQKYNFKDLTLAYFQKKSKLYRAGGYKYATPLKRNLRDYQNHFICVFDGCQHLFIACLYMGS